MIIMNVRISIITWITNSENKNNSKKREKKIITYETLKSSGILLLHYRVFLWLSQHVYF